MEKDSEGLILASKYISYRGSLATLADIIITSQLSSSQPPLSYLEATLLYLLRLAPFRLPSAFQFFLPPSLISFQLYLHAHRDAERRAATFRFLLRVELLQVEWRQ